MNKPLISICIPTHNRVNYLKQSIASILKQDYNPIEILISDNFSDDGTRKFCNEIKKKDVRIRYIRQPYNIGMHSNHNFLIENSRGEFICFFHDDDIYEPNIVSCSLNFLLENPEVGIVCSDWDLIDANSKRIGIRINKVKQITPGFGYIKQTLHSGRSSICCSGAMIRKRALDGIRFNPEGSIGFSDFVVWFQIAEKYSIGHIPDILFHYRIHESAYSQRTISSISVDYSSTLFKFCQQHLERFPQHLRLVKKFKIFIKRYIFWALAYELGLQLRKSVSLSYNWPGRTVFEISEFKLTKNEIKEVLRQLRIHKNSLFEHITFKIINILLFLKLGWILGFTTKYPSFFKRLIGFK